MKIPLGRLSVIYKRDVVIGLAGLLQSNRTKFQF